MNTHIALRCVCDCRIASKYLSGIYVFLYLVTSFLSQLTHGRRLKLKEEKLWGDQRPNFRRVHIDLTRVQLSKTRVNILSTSPAIYSQSIENLNKTFINFYQGN